MTKYGSIFFQLQKAQQKLTYYYIRIAMSFIKSDSLLSNIKNVSIRIDLKENDGSNIFKSLIMNDDQKSRSIKLESLFDYDGNTHGGSLIQKLINPKDHPVQTFHYNWMVCKNEGLSQQQDQSSSQINNANKDFKMQKNSEKSQQKSSELKFQQLQIERTDPKHIKNQTKNIPKNYGKAIICFIQKYHQIVYRITEAYQVQYRDLLCDLIKRKKTINTIADLRDLWSDYKYAKCMRIISMLFLRKYSLAYIFNSRICTFGSHIKYRQRLCEAVRNPDSFKHIKDY